MNEASRRKAMETFGGSGLGVEHFNVCIEFVEGIVDKMRPFVRIDDSEICDIDTLEMAMVAAYFRGFNSGMDLKIR